MKTLEMYSEDKWIEFRLQGMFKIKQRWYRKWSQNHLLKCFRDYLIMTLEHQLIKLDKTLLTDSMGKYTKLLLTRL
jgi:hypothetical protein